VVPPGLPLPVNDFIYGPFTASGDYTAAKHSLVYSRSPYGDFHQKSKEIDAFITGSARQSILVIAIGDSGNSGCQWFEIRKLETK
jgi:hypothetical protein